MFFMGPLLEPNNKTPPEGRKIDPNLMAANSGSGYGYSMKTLTQ